VVRIKSLYLVKTVERVGDMTSFEDSNCKTVNFVDIHMRSLEEG
jgi:hypothetical protein